MENRIIDMVRKLPKRFETYTIDKLTDNASFAYVRGYIDNLSNNLKTGKGLFLYGANGIGKTGALACVHHAVKARRIEWGAKERMWCRARDIALSYGYFYTDETFDESVDHLYNTCAWLVVDELGRESDIKNYERRLHSLLSSRRDNMVVTSFTSNLSLMKIQEIYGNGFYSMLHETCYIVECDGPDRRII